MSDEPNIYISVPSEASEPLTDPELTIFWKNFENRTFWINSEIDSCTMDLIDYIMMINRQDKDKSVEERKPIKILISSPGGVVDCANSVISVMQISKTPVYCYAMGMVASAASLIYLAGHKRFALPNAYFILHEGSCSNMGGNYEEIKAAMDDYNKLVEKMTKFYIEHTNIPEEEIREKIKTDWYLYATDEDIIEKGIIHEIVKDINDLI